MGMRAPITLRRTLSLATLTSGDFDLTPHDRVDAAGAVIEIRLTTPAASAGTQIAQVTVGVNNVAVDYVVGGEEYAGAGPTNRTDVISVQGLRGDFIKVNIRNPTGGTVVTTGAFKIFKSGR